MSAQTDLLGDFIAIVTAQIILTGGAVAAITISALAIFFPETSIRDNLLLIWGVSLLFGLAIEIKDMYFEVANTHDDEEV